MNKYSQNKNKGNVSPSSPTLRVREVGRGALKFSSFIKGKPVEFLNRLMAGGATQKFS